MFCSSSVFLSSLPFPLSPTVSWAFFPTICSAGWGSLWKEERTWQTHPDRWIKFYAQDCPRFRGEALRIRYEDEKRNTKHAKELFVVVHQYFLACSEGEMCSRFSVLASESFYVHPATWNQYESLNRNFLVMRWIVCAPSCKSYKYHNLDKLILEFDKNLWIWFNFVSHHSLWYRLSFVRLLPFFSP